MGCGACKKEFSETFVLETMQKPNNLKNSAADFVTFNPKKFTDEYKIERILGSGSYGEV